MKRRTRTSALAATIALAALAPVLVGIEAGAEPTPKATPRGYDILFVRHAHTTYPEPEEELSAEGIEQAAALVDVLHDEPIASADSSIMVRTFQTADGVAADHDLPLLADEDIREVEFPSDTKDHAVIGQILYTWLVLGKERDNGFGGESYNEVKERWDRWWTQYVREHRTDRGTGVVMAHGAIYLLMLPEICSNEVAPEFSLANASDNTHYVRARLSPNGTLTCTEFNVDPTTGIGVPVPSAS